MTAFEFILGGMELVRVSMEMQLNHNKVPKKWYDGGGGRYVGAIPSQILNIMRRTRHYYTFLGKCLWCRWSFRNNFTFTWLGQSCSLCRCLEINIMTDPILGDHPISSHFGPKRLTKRLWPMVTQTCYNGSLVLCLCPHDHPDHLEMKSCVRYERLPKCRIVPLGLKEEAR